MPTHGPAGHRHGASSCTAAAGCPTTSRSPAPGSAPGRCGWPTAPTRCTAAWSPGSSSAKYARGEPRTPGPRHRRRVRARARRWPRAFRGRRRADDGAAPTDERSTTGRRALPRSSTSRSDDDWAAARRAGSRSTGAASTCSSTTPASRAAAGSTSPALDEWEWIIEINLFGVVRGCRTFVPMFKQQRSGHIVNVASLAGLVHPAGMALLQRGQGRRGGAHRDARPRARAVRRARAAWSARRTSGPT